MMRESLRTNRECIKSQLLFRSDCISSYWDLSLYYKCIVMTMKAGIARITALAKEQNWKDVLLPETWT